VKAPSTMVRHNIYISHQTWGALKLRAFQERSTATLLIDYVVKRFLKEPPARLQLAGNRAHNSDEDRLGRTVYFEPQVWDAVQAIAQSGKFSVASLIEALVSDYLGLTPPQEFHTPIQGETIRYVRVGGTTFDLGENPTIFDANTGKPGQTH
jgi:hypothetical protein